MFTALDKANIALTGEKQKALKHSLDERTMRHRKILITLAPALRGVDLHTINPDPLAIFLPSSFSLAQIKSFHLEEMASIERTLRRAHCHDLLGELRQALGNASFLSRRMHGPMAEHGYKHSTRTLTQIDRAKQVVKQWKSTYNRSFKKYNNLDPNPEDLLGLKRVEDMDLTMLSSWLEDSKYNDPNTTLCWLWRMTPIDVAGAKSTTNPHFLEKVNRWNEEGGSIF